MKPATTERLALISIKTVEDLAMLRQQYGIDFRNFVFFPEVAQFIYNQIDDYGKVPDVSLIQAQFPDFDISGDVENFAYIAEELRKVITIREATIAFYKGQEAIDKDPESAIPVVINTLEKLIRAGSSNRGILDSASALDRLEDYKKKLAGDTPSTVNLGIEPLDRIPVLIQPGHFIGLFSDTKVGKTWVGLRIAAERVLQGQRVVIISPELTRQEIELRLDVILAKLMGFELSHRALTFGLQKPGLMEEYEAYLKQMSANNSENVIIYDASVSESMPASTVDAIVQKDKPFLLFFDGLQYMRDEDKGKSFWEKMFNVINGLRSVAKKNEIILLASTQANRGEADRNGTASTGNIAFSYDLPRMVDVLLSLGSNEDVAGIREISVPAIRSGQGVSGSLEFIFDVDIGDIGRAPPVRSDEANFDARIGSV